MRRLLMLLTVAAALASSSHAADGRQGRLTVADAWSRPSAAGMNGAAYMTLTNIGPRSDALIAVETPVAARVELHRMAMNGAVMSMRREVRVAVPARGTASFGPGGLHMMLLGLKIPLKAGDRFPAVLVFANAGRVTVTVEVADAAPGRAGHK